MNAGKRFAHCFDLSETSGLGHFARARALARELAVGAGSDSFTLVPLGAPAFAAPHLAQENADHRVAQGLPLAQVLADYDGFILDTYSSQLQSLDWLANWLGAKPRRSAGFVCDAPWAGLSQSAGPRPPGNVFVLDATYCLDESAISPSLTVYRGADAVFLNFDTCLVPTGEKARPLPLCHLLGNSARAKQIADDVKVEWPHSVGAYFSGAYGRVLLHESPAPAGEPSTGVGAVLAGASELVIAAGQLLWEAACVRTSLWVAPLDELHRSVLRRLVARNLFRLAETKRLRRSELWRLEVRPETTERIMKQQARVQKVRESLLGATERAA